MGKANESIHRSDDVVVAARQIDRSRGCFHGCVDRR
jgi:hypothetical protein